MRIPEKHNEREFFYLDLINKCKVSLDDRRSDYASYRSWYLFGASPEDSPAAYNKIYSHIDQLVSFLYSSETTRFNIALGAAVHPGAATGRQRVRGDLRYRRLRINPARRCPASRARDSARWYRQPRCPTLSRVVRRF